MGRAVSQSSSCLSVSLLRCVSRGTLASTVAEQLVIYISGKDVAKHLSIIMQLQLKALANVPPHWERTASLIWFSRRCVSPCVCRSQRRPISRMWSTEMAVVGRQQRRNSWCGHNWVTGSVCNLHTSALLSLPPHPPPPLSLSPFCQEERWRLLWWGADSSQPHQSQCHSPSRHH